MAALAPMPAALLAKGHSAYVELAALPLGMWEALLAQLDVDAALGIAADRLEESGLPCTNVRNVLASRREVHEFRCFKPDRYFAYVQGLPPQQLGQPKVTTWMGDILGTIVAVGRRWTSNMGDERETLTVKAITGEYYTATYYRSAGDYCRMRKRKAK
jgi:hypothetical protein